MIETRSRFARFIFDIVEGEYVVPRFSEASMQRLAGSSRTFTLTVLGAEGASLLQIHAVVECFEYARGSADDLEWKFVMSKRCPADKLYAYLSYGT